MKSWQRTTVLVLTAIVAPLLISWFAGAAAYGFGARHSASLRWIFLALAGVALGFRVFAALPIKSTVARGVSLTIYLVFMLVACWLVLLLTGCSFGDCR